ncbi:tetratricopeptide repeat protein 39B-like isoform X2 [Tigriopus californicus]|uniref:tetratricopeptide repeat protein 39B-like isoform X2 n=1 Tax=Tigriopus californicus TaxID=6832 RepID=UPI0027DA1737|nr:tetratricopeptide repeat protein 39B-like isoform X2 [Tigriopus californicus]
MTSTEADDEIFQDALEEPALSPKNDALDVISNNNGGISPRSLSKKFRFKKKKRVRSGEDEIPPLSETLDDAKLSVDMFLNNQFEEARAICQPMADRSMYHALGYGVFMYLKAVMTFEEKHIEEASGVLSQACDTIGQMRRKTGFTENLGRIIKKVDYDQYTEMELHAEICYSECLLLKAALTFCEDETLVSFVKAGLKVRTCYQSFRECWNALHERDWTNSEYKSDFEGGVRLGVGTFNLMISLLPARVMKVLEFIGFSGNRDAGLQEIMWVEQERNGLRQFLASFILLGYHLLLSFFIGSTECNLDLCKRILEEKLAKYPEGAFFLFFKGRYHFVQGEVGEAISWYKRSVDSQNDWPQFHHICYWELYWAHVFNCDWSGGWKYSDLLLQESNWSKCIYAYQKASAMIMKSKQLDSSQNKELVELMKNVPKWKQRIAGKSLPMEKFAVRKAERFLDQSNNLMLPILELIYVWNGFHVIGKQFQLVERIYALVDSELRNLEKNSGAPSNVLKAHEVSSSC